MTFVLTRNNFWGIHYAAGRLVRGWSAGQMPGATGAKRGRPAAAAALAGELAGATRWVPRRAPRRRRASYFRRRPPRRPRRWAHPTRVRPRRRVRRVEFHLVNWSRHRTWRHAWKRLWGLTRGPRRRTRVRVNPVRPHNGLRGRGRRRK